MEVQKFFAPNGPKGTYSHPCISLADQSFKSTSPNSLSSAELTFKGSPSWLAGPPRKAPISNSMSNLLHEVKDGFSAVGALV